MELLKEFCLVFVCLAVSTTCQPQSDSADRYLSLPIRDKCNKRFKEAQYNGRNFFYSGNDPELKNEKFDWLDSRNTCRERCMETVSFETQEKFDFFKKYIEQQNISFIWTSGRLCDFAGCEGRWDLLPKRIKGWLWSANQVPIAETNKIPPGWGYQPWSFTGIRKRPQPDNAEIYISQTSEACLGILNNMYNDSVAWHDIACYHKTRFICEDSQLLLDDVEREEEEGNSPTTVKPTTSTTTERKTSTSRSTTVHSTTEDYLGLGTTDVNLIESSNLLKRQNLDDETSTVGSTTEEIKEAEVSTAAHSSTDVPSTTQAESTTHAEVTTETEAATTTRRSRLRGRQKETTTSEASSSVEPRRRGVFRNKPTTESTEGRKISDDDKKDGTTTEASPTTTEKEIVKGNETLNSTDAEEKIVEEVETTTAAEASSTRRAGRRLRRPVPSRADN